MRSPNAPHRTRPITSSKVQRFRRLTVKQRYAVVDAVAAGQSLLAAAEHVGVTTATVYWHCHQDLQFRERVWRARGTGDPLRPGIHSSSVHREWGFAASVVERTSRGDGREFPDGLQRIRS